MSAILEHRSTRVVASRVRARTIAIDTWCLGRYARNHGVYVYARRLLEHFRRLAGDSGVEIVPYTSNAADHDANLLQPAPSFQPRRTGLLKFNRLWRFGGAGMLAKRQGADLVFSPHCTSLYAGHVVTIHDLIPLFLPTAPRRINETLRFSLWWSAKFSRAIITDSVHSKQDLINTYGLPEGKVAVIHLAYDKATFNTTPVDPECQAALRKRLGIRRPYILHHGVIKPNKNLQRLVEAYHLLIGRNPSVEVDLVLAGSPGWQFEDVVKAAYQGSGKVILTGALPDEDLVMLLKGASLAVFPSLYEGFCLPMVEAMACGVPTIAANSSCLPEISGGVLRYFHPESVEEMSSCMEEVLESCELRRQLSERGQERAAQFDWTRCAEETLAVLKKQLAIGS